MPPADRKPFFENLDALRFFSFLAVFLFHVHLYDYVHRYTNNIIILNIIRLLASGGWGVTFFFVLSGFLITYLLLVEDQKTNKISVIDFYLRRVFRIWPLYYLVFIIGVFVLPYLYKVTGQTLLFDYNLFYYGTFLSNFGVLFLDPAYENIRSFPILMNISWSVSIEEQFYLIWPLVFVWTPKRLWKYIFVCFLIVSFFVAWLYKEQIHVIYLNTLIRIGEIAIGGWLAYAHFNNAKFQRWCANLSRSVIFSAYLLIAVFILLEYIYPVLLKYGFPVSPFTHYIIRIFVSIMFGVVIIEQNFSKNSLFKFGKLKRISALGRISYGLYMLHPLSLFICYQVCNRLLAGSALNTPAYIVSCFVLTVIIAKLSFRFIERPFLRLKGKFSKV